MIKKDFLDGIEFRIIRDYKIHKSRKICYCKANSYLKKEIDKINKSILIDKKVYFSNKKQIITDIEKLSKRVLKDYTVVKFDFKKFYNTVNINYVIQKCDINKSLSIKQQIFLRDYADFLKYCMPGINLNTTLIEVIAKEFDKELINNCQDIIFYERYVDDVILIIKRKISIEEIKNILDTAVDKVFFDENIIFKNKTQIHYEKKFAYFTNDDLPKSIDFLDITMTFADKITIDISEKEKLKFKNLIKNIILKYNQNQDALRILLKILAKGIVYKKVKNNKINWVFKGIASKYRFISQYDCFVEKEDFCKDIYKKIFIELDLPIPYFLKGEKSSEGFNIKYNIQNKKYFVLDEKKGLPKEKLLNIMIKLGKNYNKSVKYLDMSKDLLKICYLT